MTNDELIDQMRRSFKFCQMVRSFSDTEWKYLRLRYGLAGNRRHYPREIEETGLIVGEVERIERRVLRILKTYAHACKTSELDGPSKANETKQPRCEDCRFWERYLDDDPCGVCRIRRPLIDDDGDTIWPETHENDWCGEFQAKGDE